ncbi:hypothetical protein FOA52_011823 [Chlamydomonas sp. UWO 241]|nr:hypothetical protein FOA52_011823 [Chlamydomonas sp. UWO 241]
MELLLAAVGGSLLVPLAIAGGCFNSTPAKALKYVDGVDNSKAGQSVATNATNNSAATGNGTATAPGNTENERDASASATPSVAPSTRGAASGGGSALTSSNAVAAPATTNVATADMHAHGAAGAASGGGSALTSSNAVAAPANTNVATAGGGPAALQATSGGASGIHQEIKSIALALSGEANKLILLEPIGQGGFGTVYLGRWRGLEVAVKTVLFSESNQMGTTSKARHAAQPQQRAIMEAAVCTSVMHPNVVSTYHYDLAPIAATKDADAILALSAALDDLRGLCRMRPTVRPARRLLPRLLSLPGLLLLPPPVASAAGAPAAERPAAAGAARAASARGPCRQGGLPARVGDASLRLSFVASISVEDAIVFGTGGDGCGHANDVFSGCFADDAVEARRRAADAAAGVSMSVRLATNIVRFMHDNTGNWDGPAGGGVVSASFINAKPAVGGIGVEPRGGGVLRVLFTVASGAVADTVVRWRWKLRQTQVAVFDVLSDREEARHRALWPAFLAAKAAGKRAQFHRARLVVDGERVAAPVC